MLKEDEVVLLMPHKAVDNAKDRLENKIGEYQHLLEQVRIIEDRVSEAQLEGEVYEVKFNLKDNYEDHAYLRCSIKAPMVHGSVHDLVEEYDGKVEWVGDESEYRISFRKSLIP